MDEDDVKVEIDDDGDVRASVERGGWRVDGWIDGVDESVSRVQIAAEMSVGELGAIIMKCYGATVIKAEAAIVSACDRMAAPRPYEAIGAVCDALEKHEADADTPPTPLAQLADEIEAVAELGTVEAHERLRELAQRAREMGR